MRSSYALVIVVFVAMMGFSCKSNRGKYLKQGEIHYKIDYIGDLRVPEEFLPSTLIVSFKDDKILFDMSGLGNSGILNLTNPKDGIFDTYFSFIAVKYYYSAIPGELYPGFEAMEGIQINKTSKTSNICGFNCKNAEVTFPDNKDTVYQIWYTDEIQVKNPNSSNPFKEIDGVLMNFFFRMGPTELHFNAETVYDKNISDKTFERREKYTRVSRDQIKKVIDKMVSL